MSTLFDAVIEHRVVITFNTLYLSQVSFAAVIIAGSLVLRRESLRVEMELQVYRTHMDELVEARVRELDEAHERLAEESRERRATEEVLRRRVEELRRPPRAWRRSLRGAPRSAEALHEATERRPSGLFKARYVRVRLLTDGEGRSWRRPPASTRPRRRRQAKGHAAGHDGAADAQRPGPGRHGHGDGRLRDGRRGRRRLARPGPQTVRQAGSGGVGVVNRSWPSPWWRPSGPAGALIIARETPAPARLPRRSASWRARSARRSPR